MSLITVAQIAAIHGIINVRRRLTIVVTTTVQVIKLEACAQSLSHVYAKKRLEMVLTVDSVPAIVVSKIADRREGIGEKEMFYGRNHEVVWVGKDELFVLLAVNKYT